MSKKTAFVLFLLAFILRTYRLEPNLFFGWEQGRDALVIQNLLQKGDFFLLGPKTDLEGIFHGAFFYYFIAFFYLIGQGNPFVPALAIATIQAIGAPFLFLTAKNDLKAFTRLSIALLYIFSFEANIFSRWLSNPSLVLPFTIFLLFLFTQKFHSRNWLFILILWSVIFHLEFPAAILLFPCLFLFWFKNKQFFSLNNYLLVPGILILAFLPYLVFDFKNNHLLSNALFQLILHPNPNPLAWPAFFRNFYTALSRELTLTIFPSSPQTSKLLIIVGLFSLFKNRKHSYSPFILVGLLSLVGLILIHSVPMPQIIVWLLPFFYFPTALALEIVPRSSLKIIFLTLILFANFNYWLRRIDSSENFFFRSYQYTFLANQKQILDYVYQKADGQPFSYHYYTYPYWLPQAWQYLFNWYGQKQYHYQPSDKITNPFYVVIEPDETMPGYQKDWYQKMNRESQKIDEFQTGRLKVEQHRLISHP